MHKRYNGTLKPNSYQNINLTLAGKTHSINNNGDSTSYSYTTAGELDYSTLANGDIHRILERDSDRNVTYVQIQRATSSLYSGQEYDLYGRVTKYIRYDREKSLPGVQIQESEMFYGTLWLEKEEDAKNNQTLYERDKVGNIVQTTKVMA